MDNIVKKAYEIIENKSADEAVEFVKSLNDEEINQRLALIEAQIYMSKYETLSAVGL